MCGIVGSIGNLKIENFKRSLASIKHRGPDNENIYVYNLDDAIEIPDGNVINDDTRYMALGHRRLSIIDLSVEANQPMTFDRYTLIFNGEIYNYKELKGELLGYGHSFHTESDTEVLLKSYLQWGKKCVEKFNGMWAFCIFDRVSQECFLSRDRIGVKPLYYYMDDDRFYFASEIKALLEFEIKRVANKKELIKYIIYGNQEHQSPTMFRDIKKFPAGFTGTYDIKKRHLQLEEFFNLEHLSTVGNTDNEETLISKIQKTIDTSVSLRMRSDVDIGMALSGGVDSNIVVSLVSQKDNRIETFSSIYTDDESINETKNIAITIDRLNLKSNFTTVTKESIIQDIEKIVWHQDEPFDTLGILAQNKVYEMMHSKNVKVSLDGQGADEIFAGYPTYKVIYLRENLRNIFKYPEFFRCGFLSLQNLKLLLLSFFPSIFEKMYFQKRAKTIFNNAPFLPSEKKGFVFLNNLNQKLVYDTTEYLKVLLRYVDRNSMQFSVESRGIFLDYKVIENALSIPSKFKIKDCFTKYILRKTYSTLVDETVLWDKKKLGFPVPQKEWLQDSEVIEFLDSFIQQSNIIKALELKKIPVENSILYWKIANIAIWEKVFKIEGVE